MLSGVIAGGADIEEVLGSPPASEQRFAEFGAPAGKRTKVGGIAQRRWSDD